MKALIQPDRASGKERQMGLTGSDARDVAIQAQQPYTVLVVEMSPANTGDDFPAHLIEKIHDRVPESRQVAWDGHDTLAVLMPETPSCLIAQVTDMICVEIAAHQPPDRQMITTYTYPPFSASPGV